MLVNLRSLRNVGSLLREGAQVGLGVASRLSTAGLTPFLLPPSLPIHPPSLLPSTSPPARLPQLTPWLTFLDTLPLPQVLTLTKLPPANTSLDSPLTDISSTPWLPLFDTPPIHKKTSQSYPPNLVSLYLFILPSFASLLCQYSLLGRTLCPSIDTLLAP